MPKQPRDVGGPTVLLSHATDKMAAEGANSRLLPEWAQADLKAAALGMEVNAWDLDRALIQALSAVATGGSRRGDRDAVARQIRHLLYKTEAVIENWATGLPPYEGGPRSPRIAELERELSNAAAALRESGSDILRLEEQLSQVEGDWARLAASARETSDRLNYTLSLVDDVTKARVEGYTDGLREARRD